MKCQSCGRTSAWQGNMLVSTGPAKVCQDCGYAEDLDALEHFIYHPRLNGCSNVCLVCDHAAGMCEWEADPTTWPDDNNGHHPDCAYAAARRKLNPRRGELDAWVDSQ